VNPPSAVFAAVVFAVGCTDSNHLMLPSPSDHAGVVATFLVPAGAVPAAK